VCVVALVVRRRMGVRMVAEGACVVCKCSCASSLVCVKRAFATPGFRVETCPAEMCDGISSFRPDS